MDIHDTDDDFGARTVSRPSMSNTIAAHQARIAELEAQEAGFIQSIVELCAENKLLREENKLLKENYDKWAALPGREE